MASEEVMEELDALMAILEEDTVEVTKEGDRPRVCISWHLKGRKGTKIYQTQNDNVCYRKMR
jgi:hypothetical protein